jgi:hypothetical protein
MLTNPSRSFTMPARTRIAAIVSAILLTPALLCAQGTQDTPEASPAPTGPYLKLVYRTLQIGEDGKVVSSHSYSTIVVANTGHASPSQIRSDDKIPILTSNTSGGDIQYQYQNVGTDIDTYGAKLSGNQLTVNLSVNLNEIAKSDVTAQKPITAPVVRQLKWQSDVIAILGKPTIVFTSDSPSNTGKTELELTATEIKQP